MKVLHVYSKYYPNTVGGLQESIRQIITSTSKRGVENRVFALDSESPGKYDYPEVTVYKAKLLFSWASCDFGFVQAFSMFKKLTNWADIVHYHYPWPFADLMHLMCKNKKPSVMTYHSDVLNKGILGSLYYPLMKKMLNNMDKVIVTSPNYFQGSKLLATIDPEKMDIIHLGINECTYKNDLELSKHVDVYERFNVRQGEYVLFIGVPRNYKGLNTLVASGSKILGNVVLAGPTGDEKLFRGFSQPMPNIRFLGPVTGAEKLALLSGCIGLVLPSDKRSEAFGMVLVEASMMSKPMITCEIGTGTSFVNKHRETGIVVDPDSEEQLVSAINMMIEDEEMACRLGVAARNRYESLFAGSKMGSLYVELYEDLLDG